MKKIVQVYRSERKEGAYVYLERGQDTKMLPDDMRKLLGNLSPALTVVLTPEKKLARADAAQVLESIEEKGFYLQMPPQAEAYIHQIPNDKLPESH